MLWVLAVVALAAVAAVKMKQTKDAVVAAAALPTHPEQFAQALLDTLSLNDLVQAVVSGNARILSQTPGVGKKTAERIVRELGDMVGVKEAWMNQAPTANLPPELLAKNDALLALISLGYKQPDAQKAIDRLSGDLTTSDEMLRAALRLLQG